MLTYVNQRQFCFRALPTLLRFNETHINPHFLPPCSAQFSKYGVHSSFLTQRVNWSSLVKRIHSLCFLTFPQSGQMNKIALVLLLSSTASISHLLTGFWRFFTDRNNNLAFPIALITTILLIKLITDIHHFVGNPIRFHFLPPFNYL